MPGRVSVRVSNSSARAGKPRAPTKRLTSPDSAIPNERPATSLRAQVCAVFGEVHRSNTGHRKLVVVLRKIQEVCCYEPAKPRKQSSHEDFDENDFNEEVARCLLRILTVKKSEPEGDRIVKFLGLFLKYASDLDIAIFQDEDPNGIYSFPETPSSRLTSQIISVLLPMLSAKDKIVRFRGTQIIAHLINTLDSVDDELFDHIRLGLKKRLRDKESNIRVQAVYGLGRLAGEVEGDQYDDDGDDDSAAGVLETLLDVLQHDSSAEVRRSLLLNLPFTPSTLPFLLERARDLDPTIRRALYSRLLPALGDFRHLSLTHREKLLRWGLRDRDESVRKATARLFRDRWIEDCARPQDAEGEPEDMKPGHFSSPSSEALLELLERVDVVNAGVDGGIALDAMREFWDGRPDYREFVTFDEAFWKTLTPESVFIARTFNDFCQRDGASDLLQEKMPEVTRFAFLLQHNINLLIESVRRIALQADAEEDSVHQEFVVEQLLYIALTLDYSDEMGRRTMFSLMREALALAELPEDTTKLVIEVLRTACGTYAAAEREFCAVVLEAIAEVHDNIMGEEPSREDEDGEESFHSAVSELSGDRTPTRGGQEEEEIAEEKAIREITVNMKCLHIAQCMLQNVECNLEENVPLVTMLNNLVVPAVRSQEAPIRERGLLCLGLCCLLDKNLAKENLTLFLHCFTKGHEALQNIAIQIIGDILITHPSLLLDPPAEGEIADNENSLQKPFYKLFSKGLKSPAPHIQSTTCTALCKLMLSAPANVSACDSRILNDDELLRLLTIAYFDPDTVSNPALRQALSYFLPVYCHSRRDSMQRMGRIAMSVLQWCVGVKEEMDVDGENEDSGDMVGLAVVMAHLVDWTDGRKLAAALTGCGDEAASRADGDVHLDVAADALERMLGVCSKDERKLYISLLGKLHIAATSDVDKLQTVSRLVDEAIEDKIAFDATTRNTLNKVQTALAKAQNNESRSRGVSRARSIAPSAADEDDEARTVTEDDGNGSDETRGAASHTNDLESTDLPTPAPSPRKKARSRAKKSVIEPLSELMEEDCNTTNFLPDIDALSLVDEQPRHEQPRHEQPRHEQPRHEQPPVPAKPRRTRSSAKSKQKMSAPSHDAGEVAESTSIMEFHDVASAEHGAVSDNTIEVDVEPVIKIEVEEPMKKSRGRPAKMAGPAGTGVELLPNSSRPPARKSVRSSRRQAAEADQ